MLNVKCPSCSKQFEVGEELLGKQIECGSCEFQFPVNDQSLSRKKDRFYHESKSFVDLSGFKKVAGEPKENKSFNFAKTPEHNPQDFFPAEDWRIYTRITACIIIVIAALFLFFGAQEKSFLTDSSLTKRLIFAGFFSFVSFILFFISCRKKGKAFFLFALTAIALGGLVFLLPTYENPSADTADYLNAKNRKEDTLMKAATSETANVTIKRVSGYTPVKTAIQRASAEGDETASAIAAIWIAGAQPEYKYDIQDFYKKKLNLDKRPYYYERKTGALILINNLKSGTLEDVSKASLELGLVKETYPKLRLISLSLSDGKFTLVNEKQLSELLHDDSKQQFYKLNIKELSHFDDKRVKEALERLLIVEQIRFQEDVSQALVNLVSPSYSFEINELSAQCLLRWGVDAEKWSPLVETTVRFEKRNELKTKWAPSLIKLLLKYKSPEVEPILIQNWAQNPTTWESLANKLSNSSAPFILDHVMVKNKIKALSALRILGNIGTQDTINSLNSLKVKASSELQVPIENAIREIKFTL